MYSLKRLDKLQSYDLALNAGLGVATLVALSATYLVAFHPFIIQIQDVRTQAVALSDLIHQTSEITEKHQTLATQLAEKEKATAELVKRIPSAPRESDFLSQFCQLAEQMGVEVADYHPGIIDKRENHDEMEVRISARSEFEPLSKFLKEIDHMPRLCRLTQLDVGTEVTGTKLKVDMYFRIYFAPPTSEDTVKKG